MLLSIIVPVYNVAPYLSATIESVLNQTFKDFELILIDDGSTDGSKDICMKYAYKDTRIRLISQANQGVSAARNKGLETAKGSVIGFVDSDDIIDANMYQIMINIMTNTNADIVQCKHDRVNNPSYCSTAQVTEYKCIDGTEFVRRMFSKTGSDYTNQVSLCTKIYKKKLFDKIHFPVGQTYEDEQETYKACLSAQKIALIDEILYHYIKRENSIITGIAPRKMLDKQKSLHDRTQWLPLHMPEMEQYCFASFIGYSKHILCKLWQNGDSACFDHALQLMLKTVRKHESYLNVYDRFYIHLLKHSLCKSWIMQNGFSPIQNLISKIK